MNLRILEMMEEMVYQDKLSDRWLNIREVASTRLFQGTIRRAVKEEA